MLNETETEDQRLVGLTRAVSRRSLLRGAGVGAAGLAAAALIGCGSKKKETAAKPSGSSAAGTAAAPTGPAPGTTVKLETDPNLPLPLMIPEPNKPPKAGGVMNIGVSWDVSTMDPAKSAAGGTITVPNTSYNRLIGFVSGVHMNRTKLEYKPELAESWERTPDGLTYTFKIKPGIKWQNVAPLNGREFVAADAAFAYQRYQASGPHQSYWTEVSKIEAPDKGTLKITLKKALADFIVPLAGRYQTIFPKELVDDNSIDKKVVGTGPMILKEATQGQQVVFEKNPDYFGGKVLLDGFKYRILPDFATRLAAFRAGQIEYGYSIAGKLTDVKNIQKSNPDVQVYMNQLLGGGYGFGMNLQNPKFKDERVRRALSLANDHFSTRDVIYEGIGQALPDIPWTYAFDKAPDVAKGEIGQWVKPNGDPAEAKKLLEAAGVPNLTIDAIYYTYATYDEQRAQVLADQFKKAGITLNAKKADYTEFNSTWVGAKLPEATTSGWGAAGFDADNYFYNQINSKSPGNRWRISDAQIDEWSEAQRTELDPAKRKEIQLKIWDRLYKDQMYRIPQVGGNSFEIMQPWMRGFRSGGPAGSSSFYYDWGEQIVDMWIDK